MANSKFAMIALKNKVTRLERELAEALEKLETARETIDVLMADIKDASPTVRTHDVIQEPILELIKDTPKTAYLHNHGYTPDTLANMGSRERFFAASELAKKLGKSVVAS